jgi:uncharacterized protein YkwD
MTRRLLIVALGIALCAVPAAASGRGGSDPLNVPEAALYDQPEAEAEMFADLNAERARHGVPALVLDRELTSVARAYAREMLRERFIGHVSPHGSTIGERLHRAGYYYRNAAENLAYSSGDENEAFAHLVASPGHHANMLNPRFGKVGVGAVAVSIYGTMFVQEFAGD